MMHTCVAIGLTLAALLPAFGQGDAALRIPPILSASRPPYWAAELRDRARE